MTTWLIGEAPTKYGGEPFTGKSGRWLSEKVGFDVREPFKCTNVLEEWPGPTRAKGAQFPLRQARRGASRILDEVEQGDRLIFVGGRVAKKAFKIQDWVEPYTWTTLGAGTNLPLGMPHHLFEMPVAYIPHPSGINQHWNDPGNIIRLRLFFSEARALSLPD